MIRKLGKHNIKGITIIITHKTKRGNGEALTILCVFNLHRNFKYLDILYLNTFKIIN